MVDRKRPVPVLCAGLPRSASTWLFNAVADLLRSSAGAAPDDASATVEQFHAESMDAFPELRELPDYLVVKTHLAPPSMRLLWRIAEGPVLITVREPRDAVASLMSAFSFTFDAAFKVVESAAACMVELALLGTPLILRYEDRFFDREETMATLALHLGAAVSTDSAAEIFNSLSREAVATKIEDLTQQGVFGPDATSERFDPQTQWHPGHLGSGEIGQYSNVLPPWQQARVMLGTSEFYRTFGYPFDLPEGFSASLLGKPQTYLMGQPILFGRAHDTAKFLTDGWDRPENNLVCALGPRSQITLDVGDPAGYPGEYWLRLKLWPFRVPYLSFRLVSVLVNDTLLIEEPVGGPMTLETSVPRDVLSAQQPTVITLLHEDAARPCDYAPASTDTRMLSIVLLSLEISAEPVASLAVTTQAPARKPDDTADDGFHSELRGQE